jgi:transposase
MKLHANARTCPKSRELIARRVLVDGWSLAAAALAAGVSVVTARKWVRRAAAGESLEDRSSAPKRVPTRTPQRLVEAIAALRRLRMTAVEIAQLLGLALSTVSLWLKRIGLGKRSRLEPPEPANRYERARPGELVHVDIKQLGRISARGAGHRVVGHRGSQISTHLDGKHYRPTGFEYVHVMVDDHSRLAYAEVLDALSAQAAIGFLRRALAWFAERGVHVERVMTDG